MSMNVLHVISDQHLASCMGCEGHPQAITPNMDRLAAGGMRFTSAYTQNPICTPSRVSILSGQYCHNHGYYGLSGPTPAALQSFLGHYRALGYRTAAIGKLHLPDQPIDWLLAGDSHDVDLWADCFRHGQRSPVDDERRRGPYYDMLASRSLLDHEDSNRIAQFPGGQNPYYAKPSELPYELCVERWCVDQATQFMDAHADKPWCMQVSLPRPHQYYTPDQRFWDMYDDDLDLPPTLMQDASSRPPHFQNKAAGFREKPVDSFPIAVDSWEAGARRIWRGYLACITQVDDCLGRLLDALEQRGLAENTIVIYHSDHGAYATSLGVPEKAPGICSEFVCRVPMLWRAPGVTPTDGGACDALVENIDIPATITRLCGLPDMDALDGCDISSLLAGGTEPVREHAVTEHPWSRSIRFDDWRYVHYPREMFGREVGELYNIREDPTETRNLLHEAEFRGVVDDARRRLLDFLLTTSRFRTALQANGVPLGSDGKKCIPRNEQGLPDLRSLDYL